MAEIKISELEPTTDLEGLYTIGSDKNNLSKKVSLQFLREAADYAIEQGDYAQQEGSTIESRITDFKAETDAKLTELESQAIYNYDGKYPFTQKVIDANVHKMIVGGCLDIEFDNALSYQFASIVNNPNNRTITLYSKLKDVPATQGITNVMSFVVNKIADSSYYIATSSSSPESFLILDFQDVQTINNIYDYDGVGLDKKLFRGGVISKLWKAIIENEQSLADTVLHVEEVESKVNAIIGTTSLPIKNVESLFIDRNTGELKPATGLSSVVKSFDVSLFDGYKVSISSLLPANIYAGQYCFYDEDMNVLSKSILSGVEIEQVVTYDNISVPKSAKYLYVSAANSETDVKVNAPSLLTNYDKLPSKENCSNYVGKGNSVITIGEKSYVKNDYIISVHLTFDEFSDIQIRKGTSSDYVPSYFKITPTDIEWYQGNNFVKKYEHNLSINSYLQVVWDTDSLMNTNIKLFTDNDQFFEIKDIIVYAHGTLQLVGTSNMNVENAYIKYKGIRNDIRMYGDSYYQHENNRFPYYLIRRDGKFFLNSLPGGNSSQLYEALVNDIQLAGLSKYIVWGLGMNDSSDIDNSTPNSIWLNYVEKIIELCGENAELILCTIPSIPSKNHEGKNTWIRNSGYRFIDFAAAVENGVDATWKVGMINESQDHPTAYGARTMADRAIVDLPDLIKK